MTAPKMPSALLTQVLCFVVLWTGCATSHSPPFQVDLSAPGWRVQQGQAVWHPGRGKAELAGELVLASRGASDAVVEFIKTPFPIVTAQRIGEQWRIEFGSGQRTFAGHGRPPGRLIWLHLSECLQRRERPPRPWTLTWDDPAHWRFENPSSGESLAGYFRTE